MFKNRFTLIVVALFVLVASLAVSVPFSNARKSADLSGLPGPAIVPVTNANELSDYYQRHSGRSAPAGTAVDMSDYFIRHTELPSGSTTSANPVLQASPIDECFDVSISELAACREASQSASQ